jgi:antitoxin component YwqK of YwqJK toxin-antitoxin module
MDLENYLNKLPSAIITAMIVPYLNLTEVTELRALNKKIKDIINMNRHFIITKCVHVLPHGIRELLTAEGSLKQISIFKEGKKHGEVKYYGSFGYDPLLVQGGLRTTIPFKEGRRHGVGKHYNKDGMVILSTIFKEGIEHGEQKYFNDDGTLKLTIPYVGGWAHGEEKWENSLNLARTWVYNSDGSCTTKRFEGGFL